MRRRAFIGAAAGAAIWPLAARAQRERVYRVGVLISQPETDAYFVKLVDLLRQGLSERGWTAGRNLQMDVRWAHGSLDRVQAAAADLVNLRPDVIFAQSTAPLAALQEQTRSIPIVFIQVVDPVGVGFAKSLAHPGGNITGFQAFEYAIGSKWLEILKTLAPHVARVEGLIEPNLVGYAQIWRTAEAAAPTLGIVLTKAEVRNPDNIRKSITSFSEKPDGGLLAVPSVTIGANRKLIADLALKFGLPAIYPFANYAEAGGLISYGPDLSDMVRKSAVYIDRILKGERAGDLPIQVPTKYELVINLKTAKAQGIAVPSSLLAQADQVIE